MSNKLLDDLNLDYLLVCCTNEFLVEYPALSENARYTLTGFSGSTGDALMTKDNIYLFVDGRYHTQADNEAKDGVTVIKLKLGQKQDDEIRKLISPDKILGVVAKKVSQARLEKFKEYKIKGLMLHDAKIECRQADADNVIHITDKSYDMVNNLKIYEYVVNLNTESFIQEK